MPVINIFVADDDYDKVVAALSAQHVSDEEVPPEEAAKLSILRWIRDQVSSFDWEAYSRQYSENWTPPSPEISAPVDWVQPTHAENSYQIGDVVFWEGGVYRCVAGDGAGNNSWAPDEYGWERIGGRPD